MGLLADEYCTPRWVWEPWHNVFDFKLDAAATDQNHLFVCDKWYTKEQDALKQDWRQDSRGGSVWCNPPYSRKGGPINVWIEKAEDQARLGVTTVMLLPSDTSTRWFNDHLYNHRPGIFRVSYHFVRGRIQFVGATGPAKFGSLVAVFEPWLVQGKHSEQSSAVPNGS